MNWKTSLQPLERALIGSTTHSPTSQRQRTLIRRKRLSGENFENNRAATALYAPGSRDFPRVVTQKVWKGAASKTSGRKSVSSGPRPLMPPPTIVPGLAFVPRQPRETLRNAARKTRLRVRIVRLRNRISARPGINAPAGLRVFSRLNGECAEWREDFLQSDELKFIGLSFFFA